MSRSTQKIMEIGSLAGIGPGVRVRIDPGLRLADGSIVAPNVVSVCEGFLCASIQDDPLGADFGTFDVQNLSTGIRTVVWSALFEHSFQYNPDQAEQTGLGANGLNPSPDPAIAIAGGGGGGSGNTETVVVAFTFASPSPLSISTVKSGDVLVQERIVVTTPYDDAAAFAELGLIADSDKYLTSGQSDLTVADEYINPQSDRYTGAETVRLTQSPGISTQGAGYVLLQFLRS